jgi:hypothetical protein
VVVVVVVLEFSLTSKDFSAWLTKFSFAHFCVNSSDVSIALRLFGK